MFLTLTVNTNAIQSIEGAARVMTEAEHKANAKKREKDRESGEYFVCRKALVVAPGGRRPSRARGADTSPTSSSSRGKDSEFRRPAEEGEEGETVRDEDST